MAASINGMPGSRMVTNTCSNMPTVLNTFHHLFIVASIFLFSMVPALAVGFEDLKKRMETQNDMTEMQRIKLDEIEVKMNEIMQFHLLQTATKVREFKRRHIQLAQRVLTVRAYCNSTNLIGRLTSL